MELPYYRICRIRCKRCDATITWVNGSKDDQGPGYVLYCQCGLVGIDPAAFAYRLLVSAPATFDDIEDTSVAWRDEIS